MSSEAVTLPGDNPIATAIAERAAAIAAGDREKLVRLAITFAQLGCPYQQARTGRIAAGPLVRDEPHG